MPLYTSKMTNKKNDTPSRLRRKKLTGFINWLQSSNLTKAMLIEKDVWDLVEIRPRPVLTTIWEQKTKENRMAMRKVTQIIKKGISDNIFNNIIDVTDPKEIWEKL